MLIHPAKEASPNTFSHLTPDLHSISSQLQATKPNSTPTHTTITYAGTYSAGEIRDEMSGQEQVCQ